MNFAASNATSPQAIMDHHAKSFSWAARFLLSSARRDAALLYAFARTADDFADEERLGSLSERTQQLADMQALALDATTNASTLGLAAHAGAMLRQHGVSMQVLQIFMDSLQEDAGPRHIDNTQDLLRFAYGVAGTVGQMMCPIIGAPGPAQPHAIALGVAMQLTNIARDVVEDAQRQRCYIPAQWGVSAQTLAQPQDSSQRAQAFAAVQRLLALADDFYAFAQLGMGAIPATNRRAIRIASVLYRAIGQKILRRGPQHYWSGRTSLGMLEKAWLVVRAITQPGALLAQHRGEARDVWREDLSHLVGLPGFPA